MHTLTAAVERDLLEAWHVARRWVITSRARREAVVAGWHAALAAELYHAWYSGSVALSSRPSDAEADDARALGPSMLDHLRGAHDDTARYGDGWLVRAVGARGAARLERAGERLHLLPPDYVHLARPGLPARVGDVVQVTERRDQFDAETGWWFTTCRGGATLDEPLLRLYWNCSAGVAPRLVATITRAAGAAGLRYSLKCPGRVDGFGRLDACVLYVGLREWEVARRALRPVHDGLRMCLRDGSPRLSLALGRGLGLAEDPLDGRSFGQSRSEAVAAGVLAALARGVTSEASVLALLVEHLAASGIDPAYPHLRAQTSAELVEPW